MIILLPLGGQGERFKKQEYSSPKPLIKVLGKPIIFWLLDHLHLEQNTIVCIPYHKSLSKYRFEDIIQKEYPHLSFIFKPLNLNTKGAVETILYGLRALDKLNYMDSNILCLDGDNFYKNFNIIKEWNKKNQIFIVEDETLRTCFSFVNFDKSTNQVIELKEKSRISNFACTGAYGFESWKMLYSMCEYIINNKIKVLNEYYTSVLISEMISKNNIFSVKLIEKKDWICLGTPMDVILFNERDDIKNPCKRYCFDLDNTLVTFPDVKDDYSTVRPIIKNINLLKMIKSRNNTIIIYTARRMKTHKNNVGKVIADISKVTLETLEKYKIPYDELHFGKPNADFYIDDLGVSAFCDLEKEIGFYNRNIMIRDFNNISTNNTIEVYRKSSENLSSEIFYYKNIPSTIREYFPALIKWDTHSHWYDIEKIRGVTISKIFLAYQLSDTMLIKVMDVIFSIHNCSVSETSETISIYDNYSKKIRNRFDKELYTYLEDSEKHYEQIMSDLIDYEKNNSGIIGVIHGDPVFTNILIDFEDNIKFIDMRGKLGDKNTILGDVMYDWAKVYQSLIGYDEIQEGIELDFEYKNNLIALFEKYLHDKMNDKNIIKNIKIITKSLLFSLLPLHSDKSKCINYYKLMLSL
uniref:Nucleotidyl transferase domain-containing protein n=1 Tax=viral metagenome TaxID=1070528 RepID=A0A6C0BPT7_9ZZZZ